MGNSSSILRDNLRSQILAEVKLKCDPEQDFLLVNQLSRLELPESFPVDFGHVGILYVLDRETGDGLFSAADFVRFIDVCLQEAWDSTSPQFLSEMRGFCTTILLGDLDSTAAQERVVQWLLSLFVAVSPCETFVSCGDTVFLSRDCIQAAHRLLSIYENYDIDFQAYFDTLQRAGEEMGLMSVDAEELDEYVPLLVFKGFLRDFLQGFHQLACDIGLQEETGPVK